MKTLKPKILISLNTEDPVVLAYLKAIASRGGYARAANMTKEQRIVVAKAMNKASQASKRKKKLAKIKERVSVAKKDFVESQEAERLERAKEGV